ncbi:MAG: carbohydrate kinase [Spirochaetaceae bacterium]|jgi:fructokinase|nr:carbohydrate kinase [Spirochaetaceae bacterium]
MLVVAGESIFDMVPDSEGRYSPCPGGGPYNTAIAACRLGQETAFLGRMSRDFFGEALYKRLEDNGVNTGLIARSDNNTMLAMVKLESGRTPQYIFYTEGTAEGGFSTDELPDTSKIDIQTIVTGSISHLIEPVATTIETFVRREKERRPDSLLVSYDPNVRPMMIKDKAIFIKSFNKWLGLVDIVKASDEDYRFIFPELSPREAMKAVLAKGPSLCITTLGPEGAAAMLKKADGSILELHGAVEDVPIVDTIGAGDTFHGAFLSRITGKNLENMDKNTLQAALDFANRAATLVCMKKGAEPPYLTDM